MRFSSHLCASASSLLRPRQHRRKGRMEAAAAATEPQQQQHGCEQRRKANAGNRNEGGTGFNQGSETKRQPMEVERWMTREAEAREESEGRERKAED